MMKVMKGTMKLEAVLQAVTFETLSLNTDCERDVGGVEMHGRDGRVCHPATRRIEGCRMPQDSTKLAIVGFPPTLVENQGAMDRRRERTKASHRDRLEVIPLLATTVGQRRGAQLLSEWMGGHLTTTESSAQVSQLPSPGAHEEPAV